MTVLDRTSHNPLYEQLEEHLRDEITSGIRRTGDRLESIRKMARMYGVSIFTIQRTVSALTQQGYLRSEKGRGTFVASSKPTRNVRNTECAVGFLSAYSSTALQGNPFFARLFQGIMSATLAKGKDLLCVAPQIKEHYPLPVPIDEIAKRDICGVIAFSYDTSYLLTLRELSVPSVVLDMDLKHAGIDSVVFDAKDAAYRIARHFISQGKERICYIARRIHLKDGSIKESNDPAIWERFAGLKRACNESGLDEFEGQVLQVDPSNQTDIDSAAESIRELDPLPDAVILCDDSMSVPIGEALSARGISVPGHIKLAGFGAGVPSEVTTRFELLNAVGDEYRMAEEALKLLQCRLEHPEHEPVCINLPVDLVYP